MTNQSRREEIERMMRGAGGDIPDPWEGSQRTQPNPKPMNYPPQPKPQTPTTRRREEGSRRSVVLLFMLLGCLLAYESFQISSDYQALQGIWGMASWSALVAFALCAIDFAGLLKLIMPGQALVDAGNSLLMLGAAWLLSAVGENFLTYLVVSHRLTQQVDSMVLVQAGVISREVWVLWVPIGFSVLVWLIQVMLVTSLNLRIDRLAGRGHSRK